jgi:hypothetical protein
VQISHVTFLWTVSAFDGLKKPENNEVRVFETLTLIAAALPQSHDQPPPRNLPVEVATDLK